VLHLDHLTVPDRPVEVGAADHDPSLGAGLRDVTARPYTPREWAKVALDDTRDFLARCASTKEKRALA